MKFDTILKNFQDIAGENVKKISPHKYLISLPLMLVENFDTLPIFLVNLDDEAYLADFGKTIESTEIAFEQLKPQLKDYITKKLKFLGTEFDGDALLMPVKENNERLCLSLFTMAIAFLQTACL